VPNEEQKPTGNHDIPLLQTVTQLDENEIPKDTQCFIMGHRLQEIRSIAKSNVNEKGKPNKPSHIRNTCRYHNMDLCKQGKMIPSLEQESIQNYRKNYRIPFDTKSNVENAYLYNVVGDYFFNKNISYA